ncbi:MAG TPA: hypothetical protein VLA12_13215, partial [Planctomycetaceae bacterium]|nr:hypothetical protein [Planctomycetaceae bacterium]
YRLDNWCNLVLTAFCEGVAEPTITASIRAWEDLYDSFSNLKFECVGDGEWDANSAIHDDGSSFVYRISVDEHGNFSAANSDPELIGKDCYAKFATFLSAVGWCSEQERAAIAKARG